MPMLENELQLLKHELKRKDAVIKQKNTELNSYFFTVSHELKTPLVAISGYISLLEEYHGHTFNEEAIRYFDRITTNLDRMEQLIENLVEYSRVRIAEEEYEDVDFGALINEALAELHFNIVQKKVQIKLIDQFPQVRCQKKLILRVLINLIGNAIKYSRNTPAPEIILGYQGEEIFHKFYVKDNGVGISRQQQDRLFHLFSRLENKKATSGSGLGLVIVKRIIEGHGGEIWVNSKKNKGATFYFTLPRFDTAPANS